MRQVLSRRERASHERLAGACAADEADNLPAEWFCEMNPDGRRNTCQKPEERMEGGEEWDGQVAADQPGSCMSHFPKRVRKT